MRRVLLLSVGFLTLFAALACGGGASGQRLLVIDQNVLHGILNEDPAAQPFDRFSERIQLIAGALAEARPDIVFLQEVATQGEPEYGDVRAILLDALGDEYTAVFGDITGGEIDTGALGQMTLTRLPITSSENHHIGGVRSIHRVTLETEHGPLDVYDVHLEGTEPDPQLAIDEIENVLAFIEETRSGGPVILAGDFNAVPTDPSIQALLDVGFVDALAAGGDATCEQAGDAGCTNSAIPLGDNPENLADRRIDYIFVMPGDDVSLDVEEASLFHDQPVDIGDGHTLWLSDHIGVQAVLELK